MRTSCYHRSGAAPGRRKLPTTAGKKETAGAERGAPGMGSSRSPRDRPALNRLRRLNPGTFPRAAWLPKSSGGEEGGFSARAAGGGAQRRGSGVCRWEREAGRWCWLGVAELSEKL